MKLDKDCIIRHSWVKDNGCWEWIKAVGKSGYGVMRVGDRSAVSCHRVAYQLWNGDIPDGLNVLHKCDNKKCVNPDHLEIGTQSKNMLDAASRGISPTGELHPQSTLTNHQVESIRSDNRTCPEIARELGVRTLNVWRAKSGISYRYIRAK